MPGEDFTFVPTSSELWGKEFPYPLVFLPDSLPLIF